MDLPRFSLDENVLIQIAKSKGIRELSLFGSVLREDFSDSSDVDLLVVFDSGADLSYFDINAIREEFEAFFQRKVDIVEKDAIRNPYRRKRILETAKLIYAA